jgi:hypothetical protein
MEENLSGNESQDLEADLAEIGSEVEDLDLEAELFPELSDSA